MAAVLGKERKSIWLLCLKEEEFPHMGVSPCKETVISIYCMVGSFVRFLCTSCERLLNCERLINFH